MCTWSDSSPVAELSTETEIAGDLVDVSGSREEGDATVATLTSDLGRRVLGRVHVRARDADTYTTNLDSFVALSYARAQRSCTGVSVCPSVGHTLVMVVKTNDHRIMLISPSGNLVFETNIHT